MTTLLEKNKKLLPTVVSEFFDTDRFFGNFPFKFDNKLTNWDETFYVPAVNVIENDKDFIMEMAAPGYDKKDFKIRVENGNLEISAKKEEEKTEERKNYSRKEFSYNSFSRSFKMPENSIGDKVEAKYENGILKLVLPKKEVAIQKPGKEVKVL